MENTFKFGERVTLSVRMLGVAPIDFQIAGGRGQRATVVMVEGAKAPAPEK